MDDIRAIMDAVGSERAAVLGYSEGAAMAALFAATYPERTPALVLYGTFLTPDWLSWSGTYRQLDRRAATRRGGEALGNIRVLRRVASQPTHHPRLMTQDFRRWYATRLRLGASPAAAVTLMRMVMETDARPILPSIHVPTLIVHRVGDRNCDVKGARVAADQIPGARYVELSGDDHLPWVGDSEAIVREIERFLTGIWQGGGWEEPEPERVLSTVLFTDIVGSSERAASLGDRAWRQLLEKHHALVRSQLVRFRGREMDAAGDGFFASFDGPARAIRCASAIVEGVRELQLEVRAGLHTGECELVDGKVAGIAVHTGARIASLAAPGEVLVSSTVKDLVAGSGMAFREHGLEELKGIPGEWRLYAVAGD